MQVPELLPEHGIPGEFHFQRLDSGDGKSFLLGHCLSFPSLTHLGRPDHHSAVDEGPFLSLGKR